MPIIKAETLEAVFLDTGVLGLVTQRPKRNTDADACRLWVEQLQAAGVTAFLPELADYELRREFLRTRNAGAISRLEVAVFDAALIFLPIETPAFRDAARLWAQVRQMGKPTAPDDALDGDAIYYGRRPRRM